MIQTTLRSMGLFLITLGQAATMTLPSSTGPCDVALRASELVDMSRIDPFDSKGGNRSIMITTFTPINCGSAFPETYIPNATAKYEDGFFQFSGIPPGTFESLCIQSHTKQRPFFGLGEHYTVVLFSPALATSRLMYTNMLQEIASHGFAVVSVDHPYDADIVEYPDGRITYGVLSNITTEKEFVSAQNVRVKDMSFLLDQMQNKTGITKLFSLSEGNSHRLSLDRVTILGHSLGGSTAAQTILVDSRFSGGINLDGYIWGSVLDIGLSKPFLLFGNSNHTQDTKSNWATFWSHLRGWKLELQLEQSRHYTFSDFPLLVDALSIPEEARRTIQEDTIGTIGGLQAKGVISSYITATLQYFVDGNKSELLNGPSASYPDVKFLST